MAARESKGTRTAEVYDELRADLLNGSFQPGERLKLVALGDQFSVSLSVIREVLTRLSEQGLVVSSPQRGFSVAPLTKDDLVDLTQVRVQLESLAIRESIERGDLAWSATIVAAHHTLERTPLFDEKGRPADGWAVVHRKFHEALLAACGSPRLLAIIDSLRENSELYLRWSWSLARDVTRDPAAEHRQLMDLALAGKADAAVKALAAHIERASHALVAYLDEQETASELAART